MQFEDRQVWLSDHAYIRYCERVRDVDRSELHAELEAEIRSGQDYHKDDCIQIAGVWYMYKLGEASITLTTCYGRTNFDLPAALRWQRHNKDRIQLITGSEVIGHS